ncbi:sulfatase-like hydrolase/transferase [Candidatus Saccharibacteria bacterium]|nr:sulfatase-like hydrolase/transferase [Candidatus Saccharibacteria bacterium]
MSKQGDETGPRVVLGIWLPKGLAWLILPAIFYISALAYEFVLKGFLGSWSARSIFMVIIFSLVWAFIGLIISLLPRLVARVTSSILSLALAFVFVVQFVMIQIRHIPASLAQANMLHETVNVLDTFWNEVGRSWLLVLVYALISVATIFAIWFFKFGRLKLRSLWRSLILVVGIGVVLAGFLGISLRAFGTRFGSPHYLYWRSTDMRAQVRELGLIATETIDIRHTLFGFEPTLTAMADPMRRQTPIGSEFVPQILFDLEAEARNMSDQHAQIASALAGASPSYTNEFTGIFADKNLIFIMAESFSPIGVHPELTPTLYQMMNSGFIFDNFYSPHVLSTIGGEFSALTGLLPTQSILRNWRDNTPQFPLAIGHQLSRIGHNAGNAFSLTEEIFNDRHRTRDTVGLTNHLACGSGMEYYIGEEQCSQWIQSDIQLVDTILPYIHDKALARDDNGNRIPFAAYLLTMAGHGEFDGWNHVTTLYRRYVATLPHSLDARVYQAAQMDLDRAVGRLIASLRSINELDNTVIVIVSDHYPYMLSIDQINELSSFERDPIIDVNQSPLIVWNSKMVEGRFEIGNWQDRRTLDSAIHTKRVGAMVDILPTLLNLWGVPFDSRLMMGRDLLCPVSSGLAIFADRSWVTDYGRFYASTGQFTRRHVSGEDVELSDSYVDIINQFISSRFNLSESIVQHNFYSALDFDQIDRVRR